MTDFDAWFNENKDRLADILQSDAEMALFEAYLAGMDSMGKFMSKQNVADSWAANPDRMGGQFTDEEIRRSERGGEGW
jgi:hypothetical protein